MAKRLEGKNHNMNDAGIFEPHAFDHILHDVPKEQQDALVARRVTEAAEAERTALENRAKQKDAAARREARNTVEHGTDLVSIISSWREMQENGDTASLPREALRRLDMHIALAGHDQLQRIARGNEDAKNLLDTLDRETPGSAKEPDFAPLLPENVDPYSYLEEISAKQGREIVDRGANLRTEQEHRRIQLGVRVAMQTSGIEDFLHVLDTHIGRENTKKLTELERSHINDQLKHLLKSKDWPHPNQETAVAFSTWEKVLGDAAFRRYTLSTEVANFKKEPTTIKETLTAAKPQRQPTFAENLRNLPHDLARFIFNEDGSRTKKK